MARILPKYQKTFPPAHFALKYSEKNTDREIKALRLFHPVRPNNRETT
jgi:hypothetical protein